MSLLSKLPNLPQGPLGRVLAGDGLTPATATERERAAAAANKGKAPVHPFTISGTSAALPSGIPSGFPGLKGLNQPLASTSTPAGRKGGTKLEKFLDVDMGMFNESLKAQLSIQDLILLPQRIFVFVITYARYFTSISSTILSPTFGADDLENLITQNIDSATKITALAVLASFVIAWVSFFFSVLAFGVCLAIIPLFWTAVFVLGLELLGVRLIREHEYYAVQH